MAIEIRLRVPSALKTDQYGKAVVGYFDWFFGVVNALVRRIWMGPFGATEL